MKKVTPEVRLNQKWKHLWSYMLLQPLYDQMNLTSDITLYGMLWDVGYE